MIRPFNCPRCKGHQLSEVRYDVTVTSLISSIDVASDHDATVVYGEQNSVDGTTGCYQCVGCGFVLQGRNGQEIDDYEELNDWILCHQKTEQVPKNSQ